MRATMLLDPRFMLDHRFTRRNASEYLDGELPVDGRRRVERHTSVCPSCRRLVATLRRTLEELKGMRGEHPRVADGVIERLRRDG